MGKYLVGFRTIVCLLVILGSLVSCSKVSMDWYKSVSVKNHDYKAEELPDVIKNLRKEVGKRKGLIKRLDDAESELNEYNGMSKEVANKRGLFRDKKSTLDKYNSKLDLNEYHFFTESEQDEVLLAETNVEDAQTSYTTAYNTREDHLAKANEHVKYVITTLLNEKLNQGSDDDSNTSSSQSTKSNSDTNKTDDDAEDDAGEGAGEGAGPDDST